MTSHPTAEERSTVIERAINIEYLMAGLICQHYFKKVLWPFFVEVLYDEHFNFGLKVDIVLKIRSHTGDEEQDLRRVGRIRNRFAHLVAQVAHTRSGPMFAPDPRRPDQVVDFEAEFHEFQECAGRVETFLARALAAEGLELVPDPPLPTQTPPTTPAVPAG